MKIIKDKKSDILPRKEIIIEMEHPLKPTPSSDHIKEEISKKFNCDKELIKIKKIASPFGFAKINVEAFIYDNKEVIQKLEKSSKKQKEPKKEVREKKNDQETKTKE